ncbi:hypothetical protein [Hymenobacter cellulosilyticus]|uniref:Uncharacterized protein n=1 Tax=Hymenobacter cellulosilyticus TaxID=2932248 RepID=A0A8T9QDG4_9BACT|nr:hypothetical protein [Hymenobacter cellulosilyticus]UOQ73870.1 hypothetical protein MUN79_08150 [Hymenobacter cellulosilyticus]
MRTPSFSVWRYASLLLVGLFFRLSATAQVTPSWQSVNAISPAYSSDNLVTASDAAGNLYQVGYISNSPWGFDAYISKFSSSGTLLWTNKIASTGDDTASDVVVDAAGNAYVTGSFTKDISLGNNLTLTAGPYQVTKMYLIRYSPQGTPEWAQQSSDKILGYTGGTGLALDANSNVYLTGQYGSTLTIGSATLPPVIYPGVGAGGVFLARFSAATGRWFL